MKKRILSLLLCLCMITGLSPTLALAETSNPPEDTPEVLADTNSNVDPLGFDTSAPSSYDPNSLENPYGVEKEKEFIISPVNELVATTNSFANSPTSYYMNNADYYKNNALVAKPTGWAEYQAIGMQGSFSFAKSVAFDPSGLGQKNFVAYLGVQQYVASTGDGDETDTFKRPAIVVQNTSDGTCSPIIPLSHSGAYMFQTQVEDWEWGNFLSITAGDYNGDGKDTIVVYENPDEFGNDGLVTEYAYGSGNITRVGGQYLANTHSGISTARDAMSSLGWDNRAKLKYIMPIVSLDTADIDRDGRDDLVTAVGFGNVDEGADILTGANDRNTHVAVYSRGNDGAFYLFTDKNGNSSSIDLIDTTTTSGKYIRNRYATVSTGDIDGDGYKEVIVSGYMDKKDNTPASYTDDTIDMNSDNPTGCAFVIDYNKKDKRLYSSPALPFPYNEFVRSGLPSNGSIMPAMESACVAMNGAAGQEYIFIAGSLYSYDGGTALALKHTAERYKVRDNGIAGYAISKTWIADVAVGNFDGNDVGREQVIYSAGYQQSTSPFRKFYNINIMRPVNNESGIVTGYTDATQDGATSADGNYEVYAASDYDTYLTLTSADPDTDGVRAKYLSKEFGYSDAEIQAIMMAAPYYDDIAQEDENYLEGCSTSYAKTTGTEDTSTTTHNENFNFFLVAEADAKVYEMTTKIGFTQQFTRQWEDVLSKSLTYDFTGGTKEHSIVLYRTPMVFYRYQILKNNRWVNTVIGVPTGEKSYSLLGIDRYNLSVDAYNNRLGKDGKKLPKITDEMLYNVQPGNPDSYLDAIPSGVSGSAYSDGVSLTQGKSSTSISIGKGTSTSYSTEYTEGFNIETEHLGGVEAFKAGAGFCIGGDFGKGTTKTNFGELVSTGTVRNLPYGVSQAFYGFNWQFATWSISF